MSRSPWHESTLVGFDLETTGVDPLQARIVTAAVSFVSADGEVGPRSRNWLVDPGVPIPPNAAAVHGITTDYARQHGQDSAQAVPEIAAVLERVWEQGLPLVVFNATYDLTLLAAELRRYQLPDLTARHTWPQARIIDPLVIDRGVDRYRRGKRTLSSAANHYQVGDFNAHSADADAIAACLIARAIAQRYPIIADADLTSLHQQQQVWSSEWATSFQAYLRSRGNPDAVIDGTWPLR